MTVEPAGQSSAFLLSAALQLLLFLVSAYLFFRYLRARRVRDQLRREREVIFGFMHDVSEVFAGADDVSADGLVKRVLFYALRTSGATSGAVYLFEGEGDTLNARAISGLFPPMTDPVSSSFDAVESKTRYIEQLILARPVRRGEGPVGRVADLGAPLLITDGENDPRVPRHEARQLAIRTALLVPLRFQQQTLGVLAVVNRLDGRAFTEADQSILQALADQAAASLHYAGLRVVLADKKRLDNDLLVARRIQLSLLPKNIPDVPGIDLAAFNEPARQIGGDYYDVVRVDGDHLGVVIADVAGKGISGALMMTICRSVLRAQAPGTHSPAAVLRAMSHVIGRDIADDMFITVLYAVLDLRTMRLTLARAGHERPLLVARDGSVRRIDSPGTAIGMVDVDTFDTIIGETTVDLGTGESVIFFTDGITDALNSADEHWGDERFTASCIASARGGSRALIERVRGDLRHFVGAHEQYDDMTLLALHRNGT